MTCRFGISWQVLLFIKTLKGEWCIVKMAYKFTVFELFFILSYFFMSALSLHIESTDSKCRDHNSSVSHHSVQEQLCDVALQKNLIWLKYAHLLWPTHDLHIVLLDYCIISWNHFACWFCSTQQQYYVALMMAEDKTICTRATDIQQSTAFLLISVFETWNVLL